LDVIGLDGDLFHVGRARHADREDHLVDQEAGADHQKSGVGGEDELGKPITNTDKDEDNASEASTIRSPSLSIAQPSKGWKRIPITPPMVKSVAMIWVGCFSTLTAPRAQR